MVDPDWMDPGVAKVGKPLPLRRRGGGFWNTPDVHAAIRQGVTDIGFDPDRTTTPFWARTLILSLYKMGWRHVAGRDQREQKEKFLQEMLRAMRAMGRNKMATAEWARLLAVRLVEAGWSREA
jgi:hypothetical protein